MKCNTILVVSLCSLVAMEGWVHANDDVTKVDFARDIQPILSHHCWSCHGPDSKSRHSELRLDDRDIAIATGAIVPGQPNASQLVHRIRATAADEQMPPAESKKPLNEQQIQLLETWISQGAPFAKHWAFEPIVAPPLPSDSGDRWVRNPIDAFVLQGLRSKQLTPSPEADRETLLRRVTLDLTGLPPTMQEREAFLADRSDAAYERLVDRLLSSRGYAERMATSWLDLARYADTNGYNNDEDRSMWPWRDWVIRAFDENMPYDQFIVEQLAGDLLERPTLDQLIATGFLRNQGHNTEGGIIQEEYRVEYVADRVHTTATVFLGLSMQCARCHDHKFDPISQKEYFQFFALLNNLDEKQASYSKFVGAEPYVRAPSSEQQKQLDRMDAQIASLQQSRQAIEAEAATRLDRWIATHSLEEFRQRYGTWRTHYFPFDSIGPELDDLQSNTKIGLLAGNPLRIDGKKGGAMHFDGHSSADLGAIGSFDGRSPFSISLWVRPDSAGSMALLSKMDEEAEYRGYDVLLEGGKVVSHLVHRWPDNAIKVSSQKVLTQNEWHHVVLTYDGQRKASGVKLYIDSELAPMDVQSDTLSDTIETHKSFHVGLRERSLPLQGAIDELQLFHGELDGENAKRLHSDQGVQETMEWASLAPDQRSPEQTARASQFYLARMDDEYASLQKNIADQSKERSAFEESIPAVMVMREMSPPRETFVLNRGQYDQPSDKVTAGVPAVIATRTNAEVRNRLELARWLVEPINPLTARVAVNRWWQSYFGVGLVKTAEDFGVTGEVPSHPQLLDFLAMTLIQSGWDVKALNKAIVMSATYRQSSAITPEGLERDPENRMLARGARFRLPAESIRDNALAISGLLVEHVGGASVKPYQPEGLWEDVTVERRGKYVVDSGEGLHRRSLYTFWKRTCPPPSMMSFDAPNREVCLARRARTNTPLQSLVLLNDPTYVEAARALAQAMIRDGGSSMSDRIHAGYRRALARDAFQAEIRILSGLAAEAQVRFRAEPARAQAYNAVGELQVDSTIDPIEVAVWGIVASALLNLDETISKR